MVRTEVSPRVAGRGSRAGVPAHNEQSPLFIFTFLNMARESSQIIVLCYRMIGQCDLSSESARRAFRGLR
eukprot:7156144-Prymnesium_polylepis.1